MVFGMTTAALATTHTAQYHAGGKHSAPPGLHQGVVATVIGKAAGVAGILGVTLWFLVMLGIFIMDVGMSVIPAFLAYKCNPKHPYVMGLVGFFFSEIYLFQFLVRKFVIKEKGYCVGA